MKQEDSYSGVEICKIMLLCFSMLLLSVTVLFAILVALDFIFS